MTLSSRQWKIGIAVLSFWLVMMGFLALREFAGPVRSLSPRTAEELREEGETWMGLFVGEERVGHVHMRRFPELRHGQEGMDMELEVEAELNLLGRVTDIDMAGSVWRSFEKKRADFDFRVRSVGYDFRIEGSLAAGMLQGKVHTAGETLPLNVPIDQEMVFSSGFGTALEFPSLAVGETVRLESFDPLTLQKSTVRLRCVAEEELRIADENVTARRLEVLAGGMTSLVWVDAGGDVLQMKTPFELTLRKIQPDAMAPLSGRDQSRELLQSTAVVPTGKRPFRGARSSVIRLSAPAEISLPEDRVQVALGDGKFHLEQPPEPRGYIAKESPAIETFLRSDAFIQSGHPRIRRQAEEIVEGETDPWRRALAIHQWVHDSIRKDPVVSIPSALEVLDQRRGDCNELTVLFTALARAAGLPSRIAIGLVWSEDLGAFYYHAWPEVHFGDWVWMDPTLGQPLADATHVKLLNGGIESWTGLLPMMGQLEIEVLEIEKQPDVVR